MFATTHVWRPSSARSVSVDGFVPVPRGTAAAAPAPLAWPAKDPRDVLDYVFDASAAMAGNTGDGVASVTATVTPGAVGDLTVQSLAIDGTVAVLWLAAGQPGVLYVVEVTITTVSGRTLSRAVLLPVLELSQTVPPTAGLTTNGGAVVTDQNGSPILVAG